MFLEFINYNLITIYTYEIFNILIKKGCRFIQAPVIKVREAFSADEIF